MLAMTPRTLFAQIHFTAALDHIEIPAVNSTASGTGSFELNEVLTELRYFVSYQGMSANGVAAYFFTEPGVTGPSLKASQRQRRHQKRSAGYGGIPMQNR